MKQGIVKQKHVYSANPPLMKRRLRKHKYTQKWRQTDVQSSVDVYTGANAQLLQVDSEELMN